MCVAAMPLLMFGLSAASAVVGYMGQQQQYAAAAAQKSENDRAAADAARNRYESISKSLSSEQKKASSESMDAQTEALKARSKARVAAGEAGVSGLSVDALLSDFSNQEERYLGRIDQNYQTTRAAYQDERTGAYDTARARINSMATPVKPSFAGAALRIGQAGVDSYSQYLRG
ncbi:hypothetical protein [Hyphomicrobium sp. ghe19]|uniref:virion core protein, T7 gp14 family n=1 Tax=Hyphomicrobium sp. ghe19 TaxID=2682968 RepID=UPI0013675FAE|nr:hypothetical protein HYPP_02631 [Hyphomicrobium sp. ghe19]